MRWPMEPQQDSKANALFSHLRRALTPLIALNVPVSHKKGHPRGSEVHCGWLRPANVTEQHNRH